MVWVGCLGQPLWEMLWQFCIENGSVVIFNPEYIQALKHAKAIEQDVYLAIPDIGTCWGLKNEAVIRIQWTSHLLHLHCTTVDGISSTNMEESGPIHIIAVLVHPVLEATGSASRVDHHAPPEDEQEVIWFLVLDDTDLDRSTPKFVVKMNGTQCCCSSLILAGLLCVIQPLRVPGA